MLELSSSKSDWWEMIHKQPEQRILLHPDKSWSGSEI